MAFFEGNNMTGGYGGEDILHSCNIEVNVNEIVLLLVQMVLANLLQ